MPDGSITGSVSQTDTPIATMGFGAREQADETRHASQGVLNDVPLDVVMSQVLVRAQAQTIAVHGNDIITGHKRLDMIQERFIGNMKNV